MREGGSEGVILLTCLIFAGDVSYAKRRHPEEIPPPGIFCLIMNRGPRDENSRHNLPAKARKFSVLSGRYAGGRYIT